MSQHTMKKVMLAGAVAAGTLFWSMPGQADKAYKWLDPDGNIVYTDRAPPPGTQILDEYTEPTLVDPRQAALDKALEENPVVFYTVPVCDACDLVRNLLDKGGIPFSEKNAEADAEVQQEIKDKAGQLAVPVLTIGEKVITGYSRPLILNELAAAGYPDAEPGELSAPPARTAAAGGTPASADEAPLSAEEAEAQAAQAAEELLAGSPSELAELPASDAVEEWEEIPDDERIPIPSLQQ